MVQRHTLVGSSVPALLQERRSQEGVAQRVKRLGLWTPISWARYAGEVRALAAYLAAAGVRPGERVVLIGENRPEWLVADLAVQTAGAITVGVYSTSSPAQLRYYLDHSGAVGLILEGAEQLEKWLAIRRSSSGVRWVITVEPEGVPDVILWEDALRVGAEGDRRDPGGLDTRLAAIRPDDTALIIYTSGTTGDPKGVMLSHANLLWAARALAEALPIDHRDELLSFLPLSHIVERLLTAVAPLLHGYTVSFAESLDTALHDLREIRPTVFFAVPRIWEKIYSRIELHMREVDVVKRSAYRWSLAAARGGPRPARALAQLAVLRFLRMRLGLGRVRLAISGAAPISPRILAYFRAIGIDIREGYGMTENSGLTSIHRSRVTLGTVGEPFPGVELRIAGDGEILTRSPGVFKGYFRDSRATAEALAGGWLHTGDIGELTGDGQLRITDRKKDLIITAGGKNIAPQKLENQLKSSPYIADAVVIGDRRKYLTALLVLDEDAVTIWAAERQLPYTTYRDLVSHPEVRELLEREVQAVNGQLARVETVKRFAILPKRLHYEDGEVTATLKVKRSSIETLYAELIASLYREAS